MNLQYRGIPWQTIRDPHSKARWRVVDSNMRALFDALKDILETDNVGGIARIKAPILIPEVNDDPDSVATAGRTGELARSRSSGRLYFNDDGSGAPNNNWSPLSPSGESFLEAYNQTATPTPAAGTFAIWHKPVGNGGEVYLHMPDSGTYTWIGPFVFTNP